MIPTYNCAAYLRETLRGVLAQDPGPSLMQIEVVDDCSSDHPEAVVAELGGGRVEFFRQASNVGHAENFNTCLRRSRGQLVHLLHGDDSVRDGFYATLGPAFDEHPDIGNAFCRYIAIDEDGQWVSLAPLERHASGVIQNWLELIATGQRLQAPAMVVRRAVYEQLGGFDRRIRAYGEDWEMWTRIASRYPVWHDPAPLALYRIHTRSLSGRTVRTGENMRDLERVITIIQEYLPPETAPALICRARENNALGALRRANRMLGAGERRAAQAQLRESLRLSRSLRVMAHAGLLSLRLLTFVSKSRHR
jgi:glycosyltransferase involved in cell wall biosynthesis